MTDLLEATNALCDADPLMADVRRELNWIEQLDTADGGWSPTQPQPVFYRLYADRARRKITSEPLVILTALMRFCTELCQGDVPRAAMLVSTILANPDQSPVKVTDRLRGHINRALTEGVPPAGYETYALGIASQAVGINIEHPNAETIMHSEDFLDNPAVHAVWYSRALATDNRIWDYVREQGGEPVCLTVGPGEAVEVEPSPFADALGQLVTAMDQVPR